MPTIWRDKVVANEIVFNDPLAFPLPEGIGNWYIDVMIGWHETPEIDANFAPKGQVDGEVAAEFFPVHGRQLTLGGYVTAVDRATAELLYDIIVRDAFPRNQLLTIVRYEGVPKMVRGHRNGPIEPSWTGPTNFRWGVSVRCQDPFRYALDPQQTTVGVAGQSLGGRRYPRSYPMSYDTVIAGEGNSAIITNTGTADSSRLVVDIVGPITKGGWRLSNDTTGELIKFDVGLLSSDVLTIDFHSETALLNGYPVSASITGDFFRITPGVNVIKLYADFDPGANMTVTAYSAWE